MNHTLALTRIEANLRAVGRQERELIVREHFEIFISPSADDWLSFAAPLPHDPADWTTAVNDLRAVFHHRAKRPRLEYIADLHPQLAPALERAGFVCQSRVPAMSLELAGLAPPAPEPPQSRYQRLTAADESLLKQYLMSQSVAFGGAGGEEALGWLTNLRQGLANGGVMAGILWQSDEMASGAVIQLGNGIGELAGVWSAPQRRNRGLAYALCRQLLSDYAAAGYDFCWLSTAEGAQRLYEKLGFTPVGTQVNYGR